MALSAYRKPGYTWTAGDGSEWSIEKLVEIELGYNLDASPCGGSHRMFGLTMARESRPAREAIAPLIRVGNRVDCPASPTRQPGRRGPSLP